MAKMLWLDLKLILSNSFPFSLSQAPYMCIYIEMVIFNFLQCMVQFKLYGTIEIEKTRDKLMILNLRAIFTKASLFVLFCLLVYHFLDIVEAFSSANAAEINDNNKLSFLR